MLSPVFVVFFFTITAGTENLGNYLVRWEKLLKSFPVTDIVHRQYEYMEAQRTNELGITFECDVGNSASQATTVHELTPFDISVVAAMGDSVTAGNGLGASSLIDVLTQNRGESWSIGGDLSLDQNVITIPNALRRFNPALKGYSQGTGGPDTDHAWLNVAVAGSKAEDIPTQAEELVSRLQTDGRIDLQNDWKLVTLFIGGNDMCAYCNDRERYSPEMFGHHLQDALETLHTSVPRMLVNLVPMFDITPLNNMSTGLVCNIMHLAECSCGANEETSPEMRPVQLAYYDKMRELATSGQYDTLDDFTVVIQPFLVDFIPLKDSGEYDKTWLSDDCFHPERKGHQLMALSLWNTMFIPVHQKPLKPSLEEEDLTFTCPSKNYNIFATNKNSLPQHHMLTVNKQSALAKKIKLLQQTPNTSQNSSSNALMIMGGLFVGCIFIGAILVFTKFWRSKNKISHQVATQDWEEKTIFDMERMHINPVIHS